MHTLDLMEQAIETAHCLGYEVRREWLGGVAGGRCEFAGRRFLFLDASLNQLEQLDQLRRALASAPEIDTIRLTPAIEAFLGRDRAYAA